MSGSSRAILSISVSAFDKFAALIGTVHLELFFFDGATPTQRPSLDIPRTLRGSHRREDGIVSSKSKLISAECAGILYI